MESNWIMARSQKVSIAPQLGPGVVRVTAIEALLWRRLVGKEGVKSRYEVRIVG